MSAHAFTDWEIRCDWPGCSKQAWASEVCELYRQTATNVRKYLKARGWKVDVAALQVPRGNIAEGHYAPRLDYCPDHAGQAIPEGNGNGS